MVFTYLMGLITPEAREGYKYTSKVPEQHTKWAGTNLLRSEYNVLSTFQSFMHFEVTPSSFRI